MLKKVVFLDRDGVINRDSPDYIKRWEEFEFLPRSIEALRLLSAGGFTVMIISNQSAINRGMTSRREVEKIHARMREAVRNGGGEIRAIFYCPHRPEDNCDCRKPKPGLIHQAEQRHQIDLSASVMVGDSARDIQCAKNAGCGFSVLVQTGNGRDAEKILAKENLFPDHISEDLYHAAKWILACRID